jgi:amidase
MIGSKLLAGSASAIGQDGTTAAFDSLEYRGTAELIAALTAKKVSSAELVDHAISRIETIDPSINAVVVRDFDRARAAARLADASPRRDRLALLGIPITVKEAYNVAGLPTTWGMREYKDWHPSRDAVAVARLKAAGAIVLGKTNVPLGLMDWQSYNDVYGTTNNPWDRGLTPGGSSGGAAAALACGYVSMELGSDLAGSLRCPAHFCGIFSHKPSFGLVPLRGHAPPPIEGYGPEIEMSVGGPMARSADDLALAMDILTAAENGLSPSSYMELVSPRHQALSEFRVLIIDAHPLQPTAHEIREALDRLAKELGKHGTRIAHGSPLLPDLAEATRLYRVLFEWLPDSPTKYVTRLISPQWVAATIARRQLVRKWRELFRDWDLVLCPVMGSLAFPHDHSDKQSRKIEIDGNSYPYGQGFAWPSLASVANLPATVVPIGQSKTGLPIGLQIIGPYFEDRTTIAFAALLEREFGGFIKPSRL